MAMVINSNIASLTSQRHLSSSRNDMEVAMERMSSGSRINSSMDDAAGLAIGNRMTSQIEGLDQAIRNANDGISLAQTAEGALDAHSGILQRMRVLAVQAANDTYSTLDRKTLNNEIVQLKEELNRSVSQATFNGQKILDGTNSSFTFQVGHTASDTVTVALGNMSGSMIGTQTWVAKAGVTAPTTSPTATGSAVIPAVTEVLGTATYEVTTKATNADSFTMTVGGNNLVVTMDTAAAVDLASTAAKIKTAWEADATAVAAYTVTISGAVLTFSETIGNGTASSFALSGTGGSTAATATAGVTTGTVGIAYAAAVAEQENYDFSDITLAMGDRVSLTVLGDAAVAAAQEVDTITLSAAVVSGGTASFTYGGNTYTQAFDTNSATTMTKLVAAINAGTAGSTVTAAAVSGTSFTMTMDVGIGTQMTKGTISGKYDGTNDNVITTVDTTDGVAAKAAGIDKTYIQEFSTDKTTTLSALGALVVNGESGYESKTITGSKLVFTGAADGSVMNAATSSVQTGGVLAADSIDDVLITDSASAKASLIVVDNALEMMADFRSRLGASSNRMFHTVDNLMNVSENTSSARSRIVDADFALESANLAKSQILQKAGTAMLSQANASTQDILSLLK